MPDGRTPHWKSLFGCNSAACCPHYDEIWSKKAESHAYEAGQVIKYLITKSKIADVNILKMDKLRIWAAYRQKFTKFGTCRWRGWLVVNVKKCRDLEIGVRGHSRTLKVAPFGRSCVDLLVFFSNFVPKTHRFWDIRLVSIQWPWNPG